MNFRVFIRFRGYQKVSFSCFVISDCGPNSRTMTLLTKPGNNGVLDINLEIKHGIIEVLDINLEIKHGICQFCQFS